jgi:hypothetical protein
LGIGSFEIQNLKSVWLAVVLAPLFGFGFLVSSSQVWFACVNLLAKVICILRLSLVAHLLVVSVCLL